MTDHEEHEGPRRTERAAETLQICPGGHRGPGDTIKAEPPCPVPHLLHTWIPNLGVAVLHPPSPQRRSTQSVQSNPVQTSRTSPTSRDAQDQRGNWRAINTHMMPVDQQGDRLAECQQISSPETQRSHLRGQDGMCHPNRQHQQHRQGSYLQLVRHQQIQPHGAHAENEPRHPAQTPGTQLQMRPNQSAWIRGGLPHGGAWIGAPHNAPSPGAVNAPHPNFFGPPPGPMIPMIPMAPVTTWRWNEPNRPHSQGWWPPNPSPNPGLSTDPLQIRGAQGPRYGGKAQGNPIGNTTRIPTMMEQRDQDRTLRPKWPAVSKAMPAQKELPAALMQAERADGSTDHDCEAESDEWSRDDNMGGNLVTQTTRPRVNVRLTSDRQDLSGSGYPAPMQRRLYKGREQTETTPQGWRQESMPIHGIFHPPKGRSSQPKKDEPIRAFPIPPPIMPAGDPMDRQTQPHEAQPPQSVPRQPSVEITEEAYTGADPPAIQPQETLQHLMRAGLSSRMEEPLQMERVHDQTESSPSEHEEPSGREMPLWVVDPIPMPHLYAGPSGSGSPRYCHPRLHDDAGNEGNRPGYARTSTGGHPMSGVIRPNTETRPMNPLQQLRTQPIRRSHTQTPTPAVTRSDQPLPQMIIGIPKRAPPPLHRNLPKSPQ